MSDVSQGQGWWQASDGKWYPPKDAEKAPAPGWWLASDGKWYPPIESEQAPKPGWWLAADGKWYAPEQRTTPASATGTPGPGSGPTKPVPAKPVAAKPVPAKPVPAKSVAAQPASAKPVPATPAAAAPGAAAPAGAAPAAAAPPTAKPATAKPVAAKPVAAKPVAAKPAPAKAPGSGGRRTALTDPTKGSGAGKPVNAKPVGAKPAPATPVNAKPAAAKPAAANGNGNAGQAASRVGYGLSPEEQIRIRNEQSKRDAAVLAQARSKAASRALGSLQGLIDDEKAAQARELRSSPALKGHDIGAPAAPKPPPPIAPTAPAAKVAPPPASPAPAPPPTAPSPKASATQAPATGTASPKAPAGSAPSAGAASPGGSAPQSELRVVSDEPPLLEVKQGALAADVEHIGERLAIFNDRVELHDRNDRVKQVIYGPDIADVVVHKKFTGSTVTIESGAGETIIAKGLKPDQADEIRGLILKRTRQAVPSGSAPPTKAVAAKPAKPTPSAAPVSATPKAAPPSGRAAVGKARLDETGLIEKLTDLHRAGILSDDELEEKKALVGRLARGETFAASSSTPR